MALSSERSQHCPFLNRTDSRCGMRFHLDQLDHAFEFCFDRYTACSTYLERLVERRLRQDEQSHQPSRSGSDEQSASRQSLVQVTVSAAVRRPAEQQTEQSIGDGVVFGDDNSEASIAVKLAQTVNGPRISAQSIFRGFDRLARRTVFRETLVDRAGDATSRAA